MSSREILYYNGSKTEIKLGDRIRFKRLLFSDLEGVVFYIPGVSSPHSEMEYGDIRKWAIQFDNGRIISWVYLPSELAANKRIKFIRRSEENFTGLNPDDELL